MKPTTKRALMNHMSDKECREREGERDYRMEDRTRPYPNMSYGGGAYSGYDEKIEDKSRDDRGREHYDNGRYAPMNESNMWVENRQRRDNMGRYTARNAYDDSMRDNGSYPYVPPVYQRDYRREETMPRMNKIGFALEGEMERLPHEAHHEYKSDAAYMPMDEMKSRSGTRSAGYANGGEYMPLTKQTAMEWTEEMENADGTTGPHWTMEQTKTVMAQKGIECDPLEFFIGLNLMYSDYCGVAKMLGVNNMDFYSCMAKAFLKDADAVDDKLAAYYTYIVKH